MPETTDRAGRSPQPPAPAADDGAARPGTVHRSLRLLRALAEATSDVSVSSLAEELDLPRSTVHRLLNLFRDEGLVTITADRRRYDIGAELYRIGALITSRRNIVELARPTMERLVTETGETCLLGVYLSTQRMMMFAGKVESPNPLGYRVELLDPVPPVWGASGQAILAWLPETERDAIIEAARDTSAEGKPLDPEWLRNELETVRARRFAQTVGQRSAGSYGLAAPIFAAGGAPAGCLCITMPALRARRGIDRELAPLVVEGADDVSRLLGYRPQSAT